MKRTILSAVAALSLIATSAQARTWYAINLDGNQCLNMHDFGQEIMMYGGPPVFSPAELMIGLRQAGAVPEASQSGPMTTISWTSPEGQHLNRVFFTSPAECAATINRLVGSGFAVKAEDLR